MKKIKKKINSHLQHCLLSVGYDKTTDQWNVSLIASSVIPYVQSSSVFVRGIVFVFSNLMSSVSEELSLL